MNLNVSVEQATQRSRKRTFAEITKSESPSTSPGPPSKRARTFLNSSRPLQTSSSSIGTGRFVGDGLDFRRPVMSSRNTSRYAEQDTIDLTLDDEEPSSPQSVAARQTSFSDIEPVLFERSIARAPPFPPDHPEPDVIDLSLLDDEVEAPQSMSSQSIPTSSELEFVGERVRTPPPQRHASRRLPPPPALPSLGDLADIIIRGATQTMFGNLRYDRDQNDLARFGGPPPTTGQRVTYDPGANLAIYEDVDLDYGLAGFALGLPEDTPQVPPDRTYKTPIAAREGYTRTYDEDDILVCGFCGDELAASEDEIKAQVWIIKQCGHAYCGACAHGRSMSRTSAKDKKKAPANKPFTFKCCMVPDCEQTVNSKTKMFQIYL